MTWKKVTINTTDETSDGHVQVHLYDPKDVLRPRGPLNKESVGLYIKDKLDDAFESWTDHKYGDRVNTEDLLKLIHNNLMEEVNGAFGQFLGEVATYDPEAVNNFIEQSLLSQLDV